MGEEFGQQTPRGEHTEERPLDWSLLNNDLNRMLWQYYATLIRLRKSSPALCSDYFEVIADLPDQNVIAFMRWDDNGQVILVVANLVDQDAGQVEIAHERIPNGDWHEAMGQSALKTAGHRLVDTLGKSEVKIFVNDRTT
jgi:1,4-alpha-glucan branching enzyme